MKKAEQVASGNNYHAVDAGSWDRIKDFSIVHPKTGATLNKIFLKDILGLTATEISVQSLAAGTELPYFHTHVKNEEVYIILKGSGMFQVDDDCFPVREGSFVKVSPDGKRSMANTSPEELVYMVIQAREGSLEEYSADDGRLADANKKW